MAMPIVEQVFAAFGLKAEQAEQVRNILKVHTQSGDFALKETAPAPHKIAFAQRVIAYLHSNGFTRAVPFCLTAEGEPIFVNERTGYIVTPWIEGREANFCAWADLRQAVRTLAELHRAGAGFGRAESKLCRKENKVWTRNLLGRWPGQWVRALEELEKLPVARPFLEALVRQGKEALRLLAGQDTYRQKAAEGRERGTVCHRDFVHHNLIVNIQGEFQVIDFEYCALELIAADLGRFFRKSLPKAGWDWSRARKLLEEYQSIALLDRLDRRLVLAYLTFPYEWWRQAKRAKCVEELENLIRGERERQDFLREMANALEEWPD